MTVPVLYLMKFVISLIRMTEEADMHIKSSPHHHRIVGLIRDLKTLVAERVGSDENGLLLLQEVYYEQV